MFNTTDSGSFDAFVSDLSHHGTSPRAIASVLNHSPFVNDRAEKWNWRRVATMFAPVPRSANADLRRALYIGVDGLFERRLAILQAISGWYPFDRRCQALIDTQHAAGHSLEEIASRLNADRVRTPSGERWTGSLVNVFVYLTASHDDAPRRPTDARDLVSAADGARAA